MRSLTWKSLAVAAVFSFVVLLILGIGEETGHLGYGSYLGYLFIFVAVPYEMMLQIADIQMAKYVPVIIAWLTLLPAMIVFYWSVVFLLMFAWRKSAMRRRGPTSGCSGALAADFERS